MYYDYLSSDEKLALDKKGISKEQFENNSFSGEIFQTLINSYTKENLVEFPAAYGGAYIDEYGKLTILTTDNTKAFQDELMNRAEHTEFLIKKSVYSYKTLATVQDKVRILMTSDFRGTIQACSIN